MGKRSQSRSQGKKKIDIVGKVMLQGLYKWNVRVFIIIDSVKVISRKKVYVTNGQVDERRTKWSLCRALLHILMKSRVIVSRVMFALKFLKILHYSYKANDCTIYTYTTSDPGWSSHLARIFNGKAFFFLMA